MNIREEIIYPGERGRGENISSLGEPSPLPSAGQWGDCNDDSKWENILIFEKFCDKRLIQE